MIPGRALHRLAAGICCAKTLEHVVEPAIADLQKEYAIAPNRMHRVRVLVAGYAAIIKVVGICALRVSEPTGEDRHALGRILVWSVGSVVATTVLLLVPPLLNRSSVNLQLARSGNAHPAGGAIGHSHRDCLRHRTWASRLDQT